VVAVVSAAQQGDGCAHRSANSGLMSFVSKFFLAVVQPVPQGRRKPRSKSVIILVKPLVYASCA
jgi:hypothetical protein